MILSQQSAVCAIDARGQEYAPLTKRGMLEAGGMWVLGSDTKDIARAFWVPEHHVYANLEEIKDVARRLAEG